MKGELIALAFIAIFFAAFVFVNLTGNHKWSGADNEAEGVIADLTGGTYHPWFSPLWEPPSKEIENLLFALQAAIGSLIIGYFLGYYRAMAKMKIKNDPEAKDKGSDA
jgi:cobalt/nickel transport protein